MIKIRSFDGNWDELASFVNRCWKVQHGGKGYFFHWHPDLLRWQLNSGDGHEDLAVVAYNGGRLVGSFLAIPYSFRLGRHSIRGSIGSWCTADPSQPGAELVMRLVNEQRKRHLEYELAFMLGYVANDHNSIAYRFWRRYSRAYPNLFRFQCKSQVWLRPLDIQALAKLSLSPMQRWWLDAVSQMPIPLRKTASCYERRVPDVRDIPTADLQSFLQEGDRECQLAIDWSEELIKKHLCDDLVMTHIKRDSEGNIESLVSSFSIDIVGANTTQTTQIDLLRGPNSRYVGSVLRNALDDAREAGSAMAFCLGNHDSKLYLLRHGFFPIGNSVHLVSLFPTVDLPAASNDFSLVMR
ncbi:hypothetical protein DTL21_07910 [Bremerella cremea]|uniref:N-acetyltransferase domain-containing protein n=1 Tax=Blastopirellula marina TaxID=124 RepID=A0A2S8G085_9BACT|nr:hypothetical protein C5Y83_07905 [Blastopirellula marina]RCS50245.1 hypothetical protein DTL21_07910 [Bremerella cremea]